MAAGRHGDAGAPVIDPAVALGLLTLGILLKDLPSLSHPEFRPTLTQFLMQLLIIL